jgi:hypothetical protein
MVGPPSGCVLCLETMKIKVQWLMVGEPCNAVPIGFSISPGASYAYERFSARIAFGYPGLPVRRRLAGCGMEGAEVVLCA